jgi:CBS domain-containing protein
MFISDLIRNQVLISAAPHQTVLEVAKMMVEHNIGAVPILQGAHLMGIFSERDLMSRVVAAGRIPPRFRSAK